MNDFDNSENFDDVEMMADDDDNIIVLTDDDGNDVQFEFLDLIEYEGKEYVVLFPVEEDAEEVVILRLEQVDDEEETESFAPVIDENVLNAVFNIFKEKFKSEFNFIDE